jgi:hypothetical protein
MNDQEASMPMGSDQLHDLETIARRLDIAIKSVRRLINRGSLGHQVGRLKRMMKSAEHVAGRADDAPSNTATG